MTARGTILVGLLLCAALLAGIRLAPAPQRTGACDAIELATNGVGYQPTYYTFNGHEERYTWSIMGDDLVIEGSEGERVEVARKTIETFHCQLRPPDRH